MSHQIVAYGCGSPIRLPIVQALATGAGANAFIPNANPTYQGGDSIVWGLIRGAHEIMQQTRQNGFDYFQIDNAYFGRNRYFRVTRNALQLTHMPKVVIDDRYLFIFKMLGKSIMPWRKERNGPIVICPSSEFLYKFYGTTLQAWIHSVTTEIKKYTDRQIVVRYKELMPKDDIDDAIQDAWCVVTLVSAAALDALRLGVPVVTTGECAASPLATPISEIENPKLLDGREMLFSFLASCQFTPEEMLKNNVIAAVRSLSEKKLTAY